MNTISNERLEELANGDMEVWYSESQSMARELLALRTAPRAPVVPNELVSELLDIAKRAADEADECANAEFSDSSMKYAREIAEWERRAATLKGSDDAAS